MVPISLGKRDRDTGSPCAQGGGCLLVPAASWCLWHMCVVTWRGESGLLPVQADLPPGIDQKQINFHFQLGIQLSAKW